MNEAMTFLLLDILFYLSMVCDFLILVSLLFSLFYALGILAASFLPVRFKISPNALCLPLLMLLAVAGLFTPPGDAFISLWSSAITFPVELLGLVEWFSPVVCCTWAVFAISGCVRLFARTRALRRGLRGLPDIGPDIGPVAGQPDPAFSRALAVVGPGCPVALKKTESGGVASWRDKQGYVIVPEGFRQSYSDQERYIIYLHELTHIKQRDALKLRVAALCRVFFWFNPVVTHALSRYMSHVEIACDRAVLSLNRADPHTYAGLIAKALSRPHGLLPGFSYGYREAARRMRYIFHDQCFLSPFRDRAGASLCAFLFLIVLAGSSLCLPQRDETPPEIPPAFTAPDGTRVRVKTVFFWSGILGGYCVGKAYLVEEEE